MKEAFDPFRDWLGIEGGRAAANYYRLLHVKPFERDRRTILAAAQTAITRVETIATGEHADARREVLAAIRAAAKCLLDPTAREEYAAALASQATVPEYPAPMAPPATPLPVATPIRRHPVAGPASSDAVSDQGRGEGALSPTLWDDKRQIPSTLESAQPNGSWRTSLAVALGFLIASAVLAAGGFVVWRQGPDPDRPPASPNAATEAGVARAAPNSGEPRPTTIAKPRCDPPETDIERQPPTSVPLPPPAESPVHARPGATGKSGERAAPSEPPPAEFTTALNRARAALLAREAPLARQRLARAESMATSEAQEQTVRRLDALAEQLERFLDTVQTGMAKFLPAEELEINGQFMSVIAASRELLSLRVEGSQHDYTAATLPAPIALIVARAAADEHAPPAKVFFGAFLLVEPRGNPAEARRLWESAAAAGEAVDDLLALLDARELAIQPEPVPDSAGRAEAERRVAREFAVTIRGARSKEQKAYLVDQLVLAAARADAAADQFALLSEAAAQAALAPDPGRALAIVDELARWFQVDPRVLKTEVLSKAATAARDADAAGEVAVRALALLDDAGDEAEVARTLALAAVAAARRAGDAELLKKATTRRREVDRAARLRGKTSAGK